MASDETVRKAFETIGEALSLEPDDFQDYETWTFLGLGDLLATATASDLKAQLDRDISADDFTKYPSVGAFKAFLRGDTASSSSTTSSSSSSSRKHSTVNGTNGTNGHNETNGNGTKSPPKLTYDSDVWQNIPKPKVPLSVVLQNKPSTSPRTLFLFPDGSGAGTSYGTLPPISPTLCLVALNSPFLRQAQAFTCSIEHMARLWLDEVLRLQPSGPYYLGGWSAGGYYSYEVAKLLVAAGQKVERLVLIDSPCRLEYEALPQQVVEELTRKNLMGASGDKKAPEWLIQHFTSTVVSVDSYMPTPMLKQQVPGNVDFIWVREGLVKSVQESGLQVDSSVKVTRFLLEPRRDLESEHWERLLPGATYSFGYMTGNHFQITQPPHSDNLGGLLSKIFADEKKTNGYH